MRRIAIAVMTTISGLVLLFSYHTSTNPGTVLVGAPKLPGSGAGSGASSDPAAAGPSPTDSPAAGSGATDAAPPPSDPATGDGTAPSTAAQPPAAKPSPTKAKVTKPSGKFTGSVAQTRWGPVQVVIVVQNGKVVSADTIQVPWDNPRDQEINSQAVPILNQEVIDKQSPNIDSVSGATVTSGGYLESLQSAFDQAHL